jgi:hypothetical protein
MIVEIIAVVIVVIIVVDVEWWCLVKSASNRTLSVKVKHAVKGDIRAFDLAMVISIVSRGYRFGKTRCWKHMLKMWHLQPRSLEART